MDNIADQRCLIAWQRSVIDHEPKSNPVINRVPKLLPQRRIHNEGQHLQADVHSAKLAPIPVCESRIGDDVTHSRLSLVGAHYVAVIVGHRPHWLIHHAHPSTLPSGYAGCRPIGSEPGLGDAYAASCGQAVTPVLPGHLTTIDSRRGAVRLDYEVYS